MADFTDHAEHIARLYLENLEIISDKRGQRGYVDKLEWNHGDTVSITVVFHWSGSSDYDTYSMPVELLWDDDFEARCLEIKQQREEKQKREDEARKVRAAKEQRERELAQLKKLTEKYKEEVKS